MTALHQPLYRRLSGEPLRTRRFTTGVQRIRCRPRAIAIHADSGIDVLEHLVRIIADKLAALIGVEYLRITVLCDGLRRYLYAEAGIHSCR